MNSDERYIFDSYCLARNLELSCIRVPVGDKGAEKNEFILWPSGILTWPSEGPLSAMDHYMTHLFHVALEAERQGVFERIMSAHKRSGNGGERLTLLDPVEHAAQFDAEYGST